MEKYNYYSHVYDAVLWAVKNDYNLNEYNTRDKAEEALHDALWNDDSVTGNGSGSYTFSAWEAEENLCHNWDLLKTAIIDNGINLIKVGPKYCDIAIRCYLLASSLASVLDDMEKNGETPKKWRKDENGKI